MGIFLCESDADLEFEPRAVRESSACECGHDMPGMCPGPALCPMATDQSDDDFDDDETVDAAEPEPIFWIRHEPGFCTTGSVYGQPVRDGLLRDGFSHSECCALDAPQYLPSGSVMRFDAASPDIASELAQIDRDRAGIDAEPPHDDAFDFDFLGDE